MTELDRALSDIGAIRRQIARQDGGRSYGPAAVATTGILALALASGQWIAASGTPIDPTQYVEAWIVLATVAAVIVTLEAGTRAYRSPSRLRIARIWAATADLAPAGVAGAALTFCLARTEPASEWMLPGLWQVILGLGFFAASRSLPRPIVFVGGWYVATGLVVFAAASLSHALSPWAMGLPFGAGQILAAILLHRSLEPKHA